ncbi:hypothetical protein GUJ93_ZPchr0138g37 [Zizania palustris]|uniref:DNA-directed DNA polymerase n=1 Tax=Zizania palustris TaxID=103762 RepID=A0A8J5RF89_ZIZPA|nr:hypothetical protein GUJ93_ZPchr0138g37 [Zizania palustris]
MLSDMPAGKPRWIQNLGLKKSKMELKDMFGFIKAFVIAPAGMHKPFLPYKQKDGTLIFPTEVVSATELGAFKLEHNVTKGVFLAPKSYMLQTVKDEQIVRHKGAGKLMADDKWFINQLDDPYLKRTFEYELKFSRNWHKLLVEKKTAHITMGIERDYPIRERQYACLWTEPESGLIERSSSVGAKQKLKEAIPVCLTTIGNVGAVFLFLFGRAEELSSRKEILGIRIRVIYALWENYLALSGIPYQCKGGAL